VTDFESALPQEGAPQDQKYTCEANQQALQQAHLSRLKEVARYPGTPFSSQEHLAAEVLRSFVLDLLVRAGLTRRPLTLPFASIGPLFKGRAALIEQLEDATRPVALMGPGGVGKTRLAIEHAWRQVGRCNAVLLISQLLLLFESLRVSTGFSLASVAACLHRSPCSG
jgi:hypothetical protein